MCSGKRVRGKTTTCSGNSGSSRVDMLPLLRLRPVPAILSRECKGGGALGSSGKVVLITGASEGIGAACAAAFRKRGARLSLIARSPEKLRAAGGPGAIVTPGDLTVLRLRPVPAILSRECKRAGAMRIDGKVVLITGASEGIGAACAAAFRKRGARLSLIARSPEKL